MKLFITLLITFCAITATSATSHDPKEKTHIRNSKHKPDAAYQRMLSHENPWRNYSAHFQKWTVIFNEDNQKPHRAFGPPIEVNRGADVRSTAINFIESSLSDFHIPLNELKYQSQSESKYKNVFFYTGA